MANINAYSKEAYKIVGSADGHEYKLDKGETGTNPFKISLISLAGCNLMVARSYLDLRKMNDVYLEVEITSSDVKETKEDISGVIDILLKVDTELTEEQKVAMVDFIDQHCTIKKFMKKSFDIRTVVESK